MTRWQISGKHKSQKLKTRTSQDSHCAFAEGGQNLDITRRVLELLVLFDFPN